MSWRMRRVDFHRLSSDERKAALQELADPESCSLGRGKRSAPLLLMNHWLDTGGLPRKSLADEVNSTDVLLERAETCRQRLNQAPNIIAIDFYNEGNIKGVIERINHVNVPDTDPDAVAVFVCAPTIVARAWIAIVTV